MLISHIRLFLATRAVARTAMRTTNLIIIVLGAGFSGLLFYALASELFAKNSPTVLYNDVCERIKASPVVTSHLYPPLVFHTHPPLTHRPRHRARHVNSMLTTDATGREHLFLNFYIEGSDPFTAASSEESSSKMFEKVQNLFGSISSLFELTADELVASAQRTRDKLWTNGRAAFAYLVGEPASSLNPPPSPSPSSNSRVGTVSSSTPPSPWSLSSIFTRLTGKRSPKSVNSSLPYTERKYWKSGEVHVDLVKVSESASDEAGRFIVRYIIVNLPDSNNRNPVRLYVERMPDVPDNEGVIRWSS
ncbi:hypothetical protein Clacol_007514 [Clathrus columnatus]|uniref:Mitochondrial import inner membrane translocase subunit Tim21 n=1 Tax=Clathrus columnatus TaxID=1419009 RepID=A0AAV5AIC2_9AGAM|nr:hypothetical protein Clacol_007514 [Clathrus columnatus]